MKVYNLTDVPTPTLESYGMLNQSIAVGTELLLPGAVVEVADADAPGVRASLEQFLSIGAVCIDTVPDAYRAARPDPRETPMLRQLSQLPETPPAVTTSEPLPTRGFPPDGPAPEAPAEPPTDKPFERKSRKKE